MKHLKLTGLGLLLGLCILVGCDRGRDSSNFFTPEKEWTEKLPSDAEIIDPEEFQRRVEAGELEIITPVMLEAQKQAQEQQYQDNRTFLQSIPDKNPYLTELLERAASTSGFEGDQLTTTPDGQAVLLLGLGTELAGAVESYQALQNVDNALADYSLTYDLLSDDLKSQVATPESLKGKSLAEVRAALSNLNTLLGTMSETALDGVRLETGADLLQPQVAPKTGNGTDNDGPCTLSTNGLVRRFWFPLKNFLSPVKNQAGRGLCWAFAAIGAVESRERVQNDNFVNLSEQFLAHKVKLDWQKRDYGDGYWSEQALNAAVGNRQLLMNESDWTYNPSLSRLDLGDEYRNACDNYSGTCSNSSHQSRHYCTQVAGAGGSIKLSCSYERATLTRPGVAPSPVTDLWNPSLPFERDRYRLLLSRGYVLIASFQIRTGFQQAGMGGFVTNFNDTHLDSAGNEVSGPDGGHAVQIVGFISNAQLAAAGLASNILGGGYFIIKNSWGCTAGDGGYYYVPSRYIELFFNRLSVLNFDSRRSSAWNDAQFANTATPKIELRTNPASADLRVETDLARFFQVIHPAKSVNLSITSDLDGNLYNGPWSTDSSALIGPSLNYTFTTPGQRTLTLVADTDALRVARATLTIDVVNTPPTLELRHDGQPHQGEDYAITALVADRNDIRILCADTSCLQAGSIARTGNLLTPNIVISFDLCASTTWEVDAPDTLASATGCQQTVKFGMAGNRQVRVTVTDSDDLATSQTLTLMVLPPSENPYPRITSTGIYDCNNIAVPSKSLLDVRPNSCFYTAKVEVENPLGETLRYDWQLYVTYDLNGTLTEKVIARADGSSSPDFPLRTGGNDAPSTDNCYVELQVKAPEASRNKSQTVWSGKCTYYTGTLN
ncbi:MAG: C1 family peptidase [Trueperaceae bacterium]|nr:C1 family peptidase [Trueperaceae bacterium]